MAKSEKPATGIENGKKTRFKSGAKAVESGRKGGIASGEAKRRKKLLRECLEELLEREMKDKSGNVVSGAEAIAAQQFKKALQGDTKAFEVIRDTAGQKPVEKVMVSDVDQSIVDEVEALVRKKG